MDVHVGNRGQVRRHLWRSLAGKDVQGLSAHLAQQALELAQVFGEPFVSGPCWASGLEMRQVWQVTRCFREVMLLLPSCGIGQCSTAPPGLPDFLSTLQGQVDTTPPLTRWWGYWLPRKEKRSFRNASEPEPQPASSFRREFPAQMYILIY